MKKLTKLSFLVPVPFLVGLALRIAGTYTDNQGLARVGTGIMIYGTPIIMFILVVIGIVMMTTGKLTDKKSDVTFGESGEESSEEGQKNEEEKALEDINSSYGYESKMKLAEYQMDHVAKAYANSSKGNRIKGWLFFGFLMTDFALCMVFIFLNIMLGFFYLPRDFCRHDYNKHNRRRYSSENFDVGQDK